MILHVLMVIKDELYHKIDYLFIEEGSGKQVALATYNFNEYATLYFEGNKIEVTTKPKIIEKCKYEFKYPLSSKRKKTIGFPILFNDKEEYLYYPEAAKCNNKIFRKNIGYTVFCNETDVNLLFKVGFENENSHHYCMYNKNHLIAVISRHSFRADNCKATIYVEDDSNILKAMMACTEEIIVVPTPESGVGDPSAGHFVSIPETHQFYDPGFIERVKRQYNSI